MFVVIVLGCFYSPSQAMNDDHFSEYYLNHLDSGPLKVACKNCKTSCLFKSKKEKARDYIVDYLSKQDAPESDKPMTTVSGYWGEVFEMMGMAANYSAMEKAVKTLLINELDDVIKTEMHKVSEAGSEISRSRREDAFQATSAAQVARAAQIIRVAQVTSDTQGTRTAPGPLEDRFYSFM